MDTRKGETTRLRRLLCQATSICGLCLAFSILAVILLLTVLFSALGIPAGTPPISVGGSIAFIFANGVVPVLTVIGEMLKSLSPWGVITIIVICVLLWGPDWIRSTISSSKWELPGGFKFDGSQASVSFQKELGEAERIVQRANRELEEAYSAAHTFASQLRTHYDIPSLASLAAVKVASLIGNRCPPDFRLTIYIPDLVFSDRLYQFTQYYDREGRPISNGVVGRTFSIRYGIIGRVWRSGVAEIEGELISKSEAVQMSESPTDAEMERFIARRWGLTLSEAIHVKSYNSYGAIRLERADKQIGLLYFDSKLKNAFCEPGHWKELEQTISNALNEMPLLTKLVEMTNELGPLSGRIQNIRNSGTGIL